MTFDESGSSVDLKAKHWNRDSGNCCCNTSEIYCEVHIPENIDFSVETINGNLIISGKSGEIDAHTISGFIDLTVSPERKANFKLNTISGTIYSNIAINNSRNSRSATTNISDKYNGGGKSINLETISGDIFFRK